jgi:hypothetical protein
MGPVPNEAAGNPIKRFSQVLGPVSVGATVQLPALELRV